MTNIESGWPEPRFLDLPNLRMAIYEKGTPHPDRPSIVLCHGFPEIAYSWRECLEPIARAGFHVITPDLRGYGKTGMPDNDPRDESGVTLYDMPHLCGDLAHLLDALDLKQAVFAGHDWGGIVIWSLPFYHPDRIAGLIGVNTPFIPRLRQDPIVAMRAAMGDDMYIVDFQNYGKSEAQIEKDIPRALRCFYRGPAKDGTRSMPVGSEWDNFALLKILEKDESNWPGERLMTDNDFEHYVTAFTETGFRGGINWYRNFSRNWELSKNFEQKISHPCLMICAENDRILSPAMAEGMPKYVADLETHIIKNCGHWTQTEQPEALNHHICDWLKRRFS